MIKIEKNIPIHEKGKGIGRCKTKYPFAQMEVGDSFFYVGKRMLVAQAACRFGKRNSMRFTTREENDGVRCWRVE